LQNVIDSIEESIVVLDREYRIVCHNRAFTKWIDKPKKRLIGEQCFSVIKDQPVRCTPCIVHEAFRTGQYFETFHTHEEGDKGKRYHETSAYPLKGEDNQVNYVVYMFKDITERGRMEEKVRQLSRFKKNILEHAGVSIKILDREGKIIDSNASAEKLFGYERYDVEGKPYTIFYREGDRELIERSMNEAISKGLFKEDVTLVKKNGEEFPAELTLTTVVDEKGGIVAFIEIVHDITKIKQAEAIIKKQLDEIKEIDTLKEEYFYSTSHEFKTPLTTIASLTKMLLDGKLGELSAKQKEALGLVYSDARRLRGAVQKILDISKIESGKMVYNIDQVDINPVFDDVIETLKVITDSKSLDVSRKIDPKLPKVTADRERLMLVVENIMSNAVKFTPTGGRIAIEASRDGDYVLVQISDSGMGIPEEDKGRIFEKYYQVKSGSTASAGGSGLGLVICKRIVEDLGGSIWAESRLGEGTTIKFKLPHGNTADVGKKAG
jgi:PAS domain S-box-containing protein